MWLLIPADQRHYPVIPQPHLLKVLFIEQANPVTQYHLATSVTHTDLLPVLFKEPVRQPDPLNSARIKGPGFTMQSVRVHGNCGAIPQGLSQDMLNR